MRELTEKQKLFVAEYLICLNATQAAISAGYSTKSARYTGRDLLKDPRVEELIKSSLDAVQSEKTCEVEEIMQYLSAVMRGQTEATVVVTERTGDGRTIAKAMKKLPSEKERLRAAELLAKRYGLFKGELSISGTAVAIVDDLDSNPYEQLTVDQLRRLADTDFSSLEELSVEQLMKLADSLPAVDEGAKTDD